jgi:hypothetical protein
MAGVTDSPDCDPIRRSRQGADRFNVAWLKNGEKLSWLQRIGFAVVSLVFFSGGLFFGTLAVTDLHDGEFIGTIGWIVPTLIFLIPGVLGLRNVLRF